MYILNEFTPLKIYPSELAIKELERLNEVSLNEKELEKQRNAIVVSLNIRSLMHNHDNLLHDRQMQADVIALQETWCNEDFDNNHLALPGYQMHLVSQGRGKGVATFFKSMFKVNGTISKSMYQLLKVSCEDYDVVNVYCSKGANKMEFLRDLGSLAKGARPCIIVGDFNINYLGDPKDQIISKITSCGFTQLVQVPTHQEGGLLDHVYSKRAPWKLDICVNYPYYSDHAAISIVKLCN